MSKVSFMKSNAASAHEFLGEIKASWNKAVESVLETAQTLKRAKEQLPRKEFLKLKDELEQHKIMSAATMTKLIKIASNAVLTAPENVHRLPPSYATLYEISQFGPEVAQKALADGQLNSSTRLRDLVDILPKRASKQMRSTQKSKRISISIRFSAPVGDVPEDLLQRLQDVLDEINAITDVKMTGLKE